MSEQLPDTRRVGLNSPDQQQRQVEKGSVSPGLGTGNALVAMLLVQLGWWR
ncbi:hypothetical protein OG585_47495 (plasmid) [Streptomyces sp. NBC_01340]|uniref:hypothetical protein n=1 Tax=unclassified Streptomyces TaxID=2593676 RepID=UPI00143E9DDA|nr:MULTISPECIES: hypothetical protein [unclassified Streptomyces]MCX4461116.1 hypothetical protein [Streptomyces sp. NBC_01719]MCX4499555.1 hypothetical protein [Streptomyces sp. NBC_01728]QIY75935.1 hypothetical protein HEP84_50230 [Streptomyces sp. RLB1-33]WSI44698.1 hypothetical protein OG585_47495 [Streptomyces sp. NBC_01340]